MKKLLRLPFQSQRYCYFFVSCTRARIDIENVIFYELFNFHCLLKKLLFQWYILNFLSATGDDYNTPSFLHKKRFPTSVKPEFWMLFSRLSVGWQWHPAKDTIIMHPAHYGSQITYDFWPTTKVMMDQGTTRVFIFECTA